MGNPTQVTAATAITTTWGNAVVSRVVGIYATLAAAETDGRTDDGALVTLTDGSLWLRESGDWYRISPVVRGDTLSGYGLTTNVAQTSDGPLNVADMGDGSPVRILATATRNVLATVAARVEISLDISHTGGSTWNLGAWFGQHIATGERATIVASHNRMDVEPTGNIQYRLRVKATPMADTNDVELNEGEAQVSVFPSLAGTLA